MKISRCSCCRTCSIHSFARLLHYVAVVPSILSIAAFAQITILQPPQLAEHFPPRGVIKGSTGAFGTPYWGEQLIGKLEYNVSKGNDYCSPDDYDLPPLESTAAVTNADDGGNEADGSKFEASHHWPRIVLVQRGRCHFAEKVKVAQDFKGASAVIIVDDSSARPPSEIRTIIMADDGLGSMIRIPSILISNREGQQLIDVLRTGENVIVELMWDLPNEAVVTVDHWMSPSISTSIHFLQSFAPFARKLKYRINFRPHFFVFNLPTDANSMCLDSTAKFCSMAPDWHESNVTGLQVVNEILRESCLWFTTKSVDIEGSDGGEYSEDWWNYMEKVGDRCLRPDKSSVHYNTPFTKDCSDDLMRELKIDPAKTQSCIETLGTAQLISHLYNHAWSPTAMMINDARFSGPLDPFVVARAICTGFTLASEPEECTELKSRSIHDVLFPDQNRDPYLFGESISYEKGGVSWWVYFSSVVAAVLVFSGVVVSYRLWLLKQLRTELRYEVFEEVKSQLTDKIHNDHKETSIILPPSSSPNTSSSLSSSSLQFPTFTSLEIPFK